MIQFHSGIYSESEVLIVARDTDRGSAALKEIVLATQNPNIDLQLCDLSILSSVRNLAEILKSSYEKIDVLINNAGTYKRKRWLGYTYTCTWCK